MLKEKTFNNIRLTIHELENIDQELSALTIRLYDALPLDLYEEVERYILKVQHRLDRNIDDLLREDKRLNRS